MNPMSQGLYEDVKSWVTGTEMKFVEQETEPVISVPFRSEAGVFELVIDVRMPAIISFCVLSGFRIPEEAMSPVAEFVCRSNACMVIGTFQLEYDHNTAWSKTTGYFESGHATASELGALANAALQTMFVHLPGIYAVTYGHISPKDALAECHKREAERTAGSRDEALTEEDFKRLLDT